MANVSSKIVDFTKVKDRGSFNPHQVEFGDYLAKIVKVEDGKSTKDDSFQYVVTIKLVKFSQYSYPYYCKLQENQLWKLRNLLIAAGMNVPKKKMKLDLSKIVNKTIGVTMEDDEYEGKMKSVISAVFPASELDDSIMSSGPADEEDADDDEYSDDEEVVEEAVEEEPEAEEEEVEEEEEAEEEEEEEADEADEFAEMDRTQLKRYIKKHDGSYSVKRTQSDDDLREVARGFANPTAASDDEDDELDELDVEDL